jgi:hypothetical protein
VGNVVSVSPLNCISCGAVLECNCKPIGPSLRRSGSGSRQSTTAAPLIAARTRMPRVIQGVLSLSRFLPVVRYAPTPP